MDDNYENSVVHDLTFGLDHEDHSSIHDSQSGLHPDEKTSSMSSISSLTGFLFGNIDEKGELEEDFLDEESKRHLASLSRLGVGAMVQELAQDISDGALGGSVDDDYDCKSPSAVDFSDITEIVDEEDELRRKPDYEIKNSIDDQEREEDDRKLMPPPSWLPCPTQPISVVTSESGNSSASASTLTSVAKLSTDEQTSPTSLSPSKKLNTPLADMMPPELANVDVTTLFPEFRHGQVLRFSRLFKPAHVPHVWRKKRKKKEEDEEKKGSKGDSKKKDSKEDLEKVQADAAEKENQPEVDQEEGSKDEDCEDRKPDIKVEPFFEEELEINLNMGRMPKKEEMLDDDEASFYLSF
ncbi:transcription initiation factor TFIID subunit 1 [Biomphalaria pfeifferi]|uniref:Transcription initiation factor TFIID subunit 1 n=1 Tax=Biomphalaria pfeifferi TaxID=112525 RepID=A0AAD8FDV3_BIOPF|nr:transcription initiation factor TFIID subunit 1 [Biomphalaria pfeifferi]